MVQIRSFWILALVHFFNGTVAQPGDSKIVGGFTVKIEAIPFIVSIQTRSVGHFCGGALLTLQHVITGCHCVANDLRVHVTHAEITLRSTKHLSVVAGSSEIDNSPTGRFQRRKVVKIEIHPKCDYKLILSYDFAILYLSYPFRRSKTVQPFSYPVDVSFKDFDLKTRELVNNDKKHCYVAGWGATAQDTYVASKELKAVRMKVIPDEVCAEKLGRDNRKFEGFQFGSHAQMCSLSFRKKDNASDCVGDSGGPFFCGRVLFGTVSYGFECGFWDTPNVYAKLSYAMSWIDSKNLRSDGKQDRQKATSSHRSAGGSMVLVPSYLMGLIATSFALSRGQHLPEFGT